jgi:general transcription factor 3C polypeptide 6
MDRATDHTYVQGLDTPTPFLQLSGTVLRGEHTSLLGTEIIFTEVTSPPMSNSPAPDDSNPTTLTGASSHSLYYLSTTSHRIRFREVQLKPKAEDVGDGEGDAVTGPSERVGSNSRKGKGKGKEKTSGKGKAKNGKGKERVKVSRKGKEKAVEEPMSGLEDSPPPEVMDDAGSPMELG